MMFLKEEYSLMNCLECGYYTRSHGFNWRRRFASITTAQVHRELTTSPEIAVESGKEASNDANDDDVSRRFEFTDSQPLEWTTSSPEIRVESEKEAINDENDDDDVNIKVE
jgi:hypothetical protein